ncbi:hypothetical protein HBB16_08525 [Pseudonocardia sp. MCCB 268]|nr:hypothetical protein [Pseudonocardia cytotoxica]
MITSARPHLTTPGSPARNCRGSRSNVVPGDTPTADRGQTCRSSWRASTSGGLEAPWFREPTTAARLARRGAVRSGVEPAKASLTALVRDDTGDFATTLVLVRIAEGASWSASGTALPRSGFNCRHIVAVALTAAGLTAPACERPHRGRTGNGGSAR